MHGEAETMQGFEGRRARPESGVHLWLVLWKAYDAMREYATADIKSLGIGLTDFAILEFLLHKGPAAVNAIGERIRLTSGSISIAIDRLEAKRLVERRADEEDRRARMVHLTPAGRKLIRCAFAAHAEAMERVAEALSPAERREVVDLLKKLGRAAEKNARTPKAQEARRARQCARG
ncbi:MAG TPA: MarR family transcriptional regulator [Bryobacteraceae bacterium]|jgi:MarR family 2-MHQ and catechol resistance regulon transcriptional repressor|nr:MarR family transcriptional regulator [Bryobacteraceae bacterium]